MIVQIARSERGLLGELPTILCLEISRPSCENPSNWRQLVLLVLWIITQWEQGLLLTVSNKKTSRIKDGKVKAMTISRKLMTLTQNLWLPPTMSVSERSGCDTGTTAKRWQRRMVNSRSTIRRCNL
jgi:hypothetical protein